MSSKYPTLGPNATSPFTNGSDTHPDSEGACGPGGFTDSFISLRIVSIFVILVVSIVSALFPILARQSHLRNFIPTAAVEFAKFFGSGVIISTAFIHLLDPAIDELSDVCLTDAWRAYPWALVLSMFSIFVLFFVELIALRWGSSKLAKYGIQHNPHDVVGDRDTSGTPHVLCGPELHKANEQSSGFQKQPVVNIMLDVGHISPEMSGVYPAIDASALAQIMGISILEFGILLHNVLIGLSFALLPAFKLLFIVLVFHQLFQGLGLGSRLALLKLPPRYKHVVIIAAIIYGLTMPIFIAVGLGVKNTSSLNGTTGSIVSGTINASTSGVLLYTGLVELLAREFLFDRKMSSPSNSELTYACLCVFLGAGIMALLGRWE